MAENDKMLNSAKSAFCGSTSAISKNVDPQKKNMFFHKNFGSIQNFLWIHSFLKKKNLWIHNF